MAPIAKAAMLLAVLSLGSLFIDFGEREMLYFVVSIANVHLIV